MTDFRVSDEDRDRAAADLGASFTEGRLTKDEFDQRMTDLAAARRQSEIDAILADIPSSGQKVDPDGFGRKWPRAFVAVAGTAALAAAVWFSAGAWPDEEPDANNPGQGSGRACADIGDIKVEPPGGFDIETDPDTCEITIRSRR